MLSHIDELAHVARPPGSRALAGRMKGLRRICIGEYRAVYHVDDVAQVITIAVVGHRHNVYGGA